MKVKRFCQGSNPDMTDITVELESERRNLTGNARWKPNMDPSNATVWLVPCLRKQITGSSNYHARYDFAQTNQELSY